jgi:hypothetical protein
MQYTIVHRDPQAFQQPGAPDLLRAMCERAFGQGALINSVRELDGGQFNNTYLIELADRDPLILRVAPPPEREIAHRLHMSRQTVHTFLVCESFPERSSSPYRGSILDPYKPYILNRRIGWVLEWLPALLGSPRTWLHWLRGLVSPLYFEPAQATSGKRNRGLARAFC